ncbi:unnamed protein product [Rotaria magnacalcarata]|uniref:Uncharacterized protein n=1 Tax=Rotaria magnacalcarata TaxID=392030 RepID=A0A816PQP3_9BILA|nr:unnamed protein product [Rotaria magnacalcarata]CAF2050679.1 unnamed protein product [Rotaria magnacalcarata]CAF2156886.1 unnamed protein product [Rotaria magnacalcarata]
MTSQKQNVQTDGSILATRDKKSLKFRGGLKFISSLLLPLALGVFTVVITFQQQSATKQQRDDDREAAEQQRINDRNASQQQRDQEKQEAGLLRIQEKDLDKQRYENGRFDTYIEQMGKLLEEYHGSIKSSGVAATLARVKTLNIFRQLDAHKNIRIIRFLYEAKQLTDTPENRSLDLSTAELSDIDFREASINKKILNNLSLTDVFLSNATFIGITMTHVSFAFTQFNTANFLLAEINDANFSSAGFSNISFASTSFSNTIFTEATFKNVNFSSKNIRGVNFTRSTLVHVDFSFSVLYDADFSSASLTNVNFSYTQLINAKFPSATLKGVDFSSAELYKPDFSNAHQLMNLNFTSTNIILANFFRANVSNTNFRRSSCVASKFNNASLSYCNFWYSNLKYAVFHEAYLNQVNFSRANLYESDFTGTNITEKELKDALSIEDAALLNGTTAHDENLINDGQADCNISHISGWTLSNGNVTPVISNKSNSNCQFTLQSLSTGATMYQRVNLSDMWDSNFWTHSEAVLSAKMSTGVSIELRGIKENNVVSSMDILINIPANANWTQQGVPIAGGHGGGNGTNQLYWPHGIFVDDDQTVVIVDHANNRIIQWKNGHTTSGKIVAGDKGLGNRYNQLDHPTDVLIDEETDSLIICDKGNQRVVRWSRRSGTTQGEILIDNIKCFGVAMDERKYLYVSDDGKHEVRRYQLGEKNGTLVAGGNGKGDGLNRLNKPRYLFVDRDHSVYVSDEQNHRVMKWNKGAKEGIMVAGEKGMGNASTHLSYPNGLFVDTLGTLYVADSSNNRVMRWTQGDKKQGTVIVGGNGKGKGAGADQFNIPSGLSFDRYGNLYVADQYNNRVQRFSIE